MSRLIRRFEIPKECQAFMYTDDTIHPVKIYEMGSYMMLDISVFDNHIEETHIYSENGVWQKTVTVDIDLSELNNLKIERFLHTKNDERYAKPIVPAVVSLFFEVVSDFDGKTYSRDIAWMTDSEKSIKLLNEIKNTIEIVLNGNEDEINKIINENSKIEDIDSNEVLSLRDQLEHLYGVRTIFDFKNKIISFLRANYHFAANGKNYSIEFFDDKSYFIFPENNSLEVVTSKALSSGAEKALYAKNNGFEIIDQDYYMLKSLIDITNKYRYDLWTLQGASLDNVDYNVIKQRTSGLGLAVYAEVFGTAAAIGKAIYENSGPDKELAYYVMSFEMNNDVYKGRVQLVVENKIENKSDASRFVSMINNCSKSNSISNNNASMISNDALERIKTLKELFDSGAITEKEFTLAKKKILGI